MPPLGRRCRCPPRKDDRDEAPDDGRHPVETLAAVDPAVSDLVLRIRWTCGLPVLERVLGVGSLAAGRHLAPPATKIDRAWTHSLAERKPGDS